MCQLKCPFLAPPLCFFIFFSVCLFFFSSSSTPFCPDDQRNALLQFKDMASVSHFASMYCSDYGITANTNTNSWKEGVDCCLWDEVTSDSLTGCVTGFDLSCSSLRGTITANTSLCPLSHLQSLNLSYNDFNLSRISSGLGGFSSLTHLNLSFSQFYGQVPSELSHISKLLSLDLSKTFLTIQTPIA